MKTLGLIGGTSWHSTVEYYSYINQMINDTFHNNTNPPLLLYNLNQHHIHSLQLKDNWDSITLILIEAAKKLQTAGAEGVLFCANTPYKVFEAVQHKTKIPVLHIADAVGSAVKAQGITKVGLVGTIFTMEEDFYSKRLKSRFNIEMLVPEHSEDRKELHRIVQQELSMGLLKPTTKKYIVAQIDLMRRKGANGIILGSTEFPLIIKESDIPIPLFNSTLLHCKMAVGYILGMQKTRLLF